MMHSRTKLALTAAALLACARALPSPGANDIEVYHDNTSLEPQPVHERFPHAVLFGGTCGGSIISPTWILTAAHCSLSEPEFVVDFNSQGTLFTTGRFVLAGTNRSLDGTGIKRRVKRLVVHPKFTVGPYWLDAKEFHIKQVAAHWDFMLAELMEPLPLDNKTMAAVRLEQAITLPAGLHVGYAGYGAEHHGETMRHEMHGMELATLGDPACSVLEQFDAQDMMCARGRPPRFDSACNGDSGSGLVGDGRLVGVASWVENDAHECRNGAIVVFSKVASAREWIRNVTGV